MTYKLLSWNVNGIRATEKKGFIDFLQSEQPFALGVQETKAHKKQLQHTLLEPEGYYTYWCSPKRKGYSGVALFCKEQPLSIEYGFGNELTDREGRIIIAEFNDFYFLTIYFPNGKMNEERLAYKLFFYSTFIDYVNQLKKKNKPIIICGDVNTAHKEIDLTHPKPNRKRSGFLIEECEWLDTFINNGLIDTFREFHKEGEHYTWWDVISRARERNVGWRIDYFYIDKKSRPILKDAFILSDVYGSDHCPVGITLEFS